MGESPLTSKLENPIYVNGESPLTSKLENPIYVNGESPLTSKLENPIYVNGESPLTFLYTETTSETTSETTHTHSPPPPTQERVCVRVASRREESSDARKLATATLSGQKEVTETSLTSVAQKNEELNPTHQTLQKIKDSAAPIENGSRYQKNLDGK